MFVKDCKASVIIIMNVNTVNSKKDLKLHIHLHKAFFSDDR